MLRQETQNTFNKGLIMDFHPLNTPNDVLTNCLNGTLITYNGNEFTLQNDMGNGRVETAYLPQGYIPMGTAELGGIIYVVSYNPFLDKGQIGCFPSPERNITSDELNTNLTVIRNSDFKNGDVLKTAILKYNLLEGSSLEKLNPGDKYKIYAIGNDLSTNSSKLTDYSNDKLIYGTLPKYLRLHVAAVDENNQINYLDDTLKWNEVPYYFDEYEVPPNSISDLESYRNLVSSAYNIFRSKVSGKLCIVAELEIIDTFNATWKPYVNGDNIEIKFSYSWSSNLWPEDEEDVNTTKRYINPYAIIETIDGADKDAIVGDITVLTDVNAWDNNNPTIQEVKDSKKVVSYKLTPAMKFGKLDHLAIEGTINLADIGSGKIKLNEYRYYRNNNNMLFSWGLEAYPAPEQYIDGVTFEFYDATTSDTTPVFTYNKSGLVSYSGNFSDELLLDTELNTYKYSGLLKSNWLYYVIITINYSEKPKKYSRWMHTSTVFNETYLNDKGINDFDQLTLDLEYDININTQLISESVTKNKHLPNPLALTNDVTDSSDIWNKSLGAYEYKYNVNAEVSISPYWLNDYNTFDLKQDQISTNNTLSEVEVENLNTEVVAEEALVSDTVTNLTKTEATCDYGNGEVKYNDTVTYKTDDYATKTEFNVTIDGQIYNKIVGTDYKQEQYNYGSVFTPIIYDRTTAQNYGMNFSSNHLYYESVPAIHVNGDKAHVYCQLVSIDSANGQYSNVSEIAYLGKGRYNKGTIVSDFWSKFFTSAASAIPESTIFPIITIGPEGTGSNHFRFIDVVKSENAYSLKWKWGASPFDSKMGRVIKQPLQLDEGNIKSMKNFNTANVKNISIVMYAMKTKDGKIDLLNMVAPLYASSASYREFIGNNTYPMNITMAEAVAGPLSQLYILNKDYESVINLFFPANIHYIKEFLSTCKIPMTVMTTLNTDYFLLKNCETKIDINVFNTFNNLAISKGVENDEHEPDELASSNNITLNVVKKQLTDNSQFIYYELPIVDNLYYDYKNQGASSSGRGALVNGVLTPLDSNFSIGASIVYTLQNNDGVYTLVPIKNGYTYLRYMTSMKEEDSVFKFTYDTSYSARLDGIIIQDGKLVLNSVSTGSYAMYMNGREDNDSHRSQQAKLSNLGFKVSLDNRMTLVQQ